MQSTASGVRRKGSCRLQVRNSRTISFVGRKNNPGNSSDPRRDGMQLSSEKLVRSKLRKSRSGRKEERSNLARVSRIRSSDSAAGQDSCIVTWISEATEPLATSISRLGRVLEAYSR